QSRLAPLPRDRFGSLSVKTAGQPASFLSAPVEVRGRAELTANVDGLSRDAVLRVELLDELELPIPAYSGANAAVVRESGLAQRVAWPGKDRIEGLSAPFKIRVRFEGSGAPAIRFYALYVGE